MSTPARPEISVIMPAYNAAATIGIQLDALSRQTSEAAWELLVADNGSTDQTRSAVAGWASRLPSVVVVDASARRGPGAARNIAAEHARGAKLLFCDADDAAEPGWIAALAAGLDTADAVAGGRSFTRLNRAPHGPSDWSEPIFRKEPLLDLAAASSHSLGVRASAFRAVGGFDESLRTAEDIDLCWRLQLAGHRLIPAPAAVMQVRRRSGPVGIFRQAMAYGRGDAQLRAKHAGAAVRPAAAPVPDPPAPVVEEDGPATGAAGERSTSGRPLLRVPDLRYASERWGRRLGVRLAEHRLRRQQ